MKTIPIRGNEYVPVVERVKEFHRLYPHGEIHTEIISNDENRVIIKASIHIPDDKAVNRHKSFTGLSQASWNTGKMKDVALEVAETSAVGRALGFANIGLIDGIASADEMRKVTKTERSSEGREQDLEEGVPF